MTQSSTGWFKFPAFHLSGDWFLCMSSPGKSNVSRSSFPTTHWSTVLAAGSTNPADAQHALGCLCEGYWYPLYSFIRLKGHSHHAAEDLTQEFLARLLANDAIAKARPDRGRFRTFLLSALRNFLINEWHRNRAVKRAGPQPVNAVRFKAAEENFIREVVDPGLSPEQVFERNWALCVIEQALAVLRAEYAANGRKALFDAVAPSIWGGGAPELQSRQAERLGLSVTAFKVAVHRMRKRLREHLESQIRATVETDAEVAAELVHLLAAVGNPKPP